MLEICETLRADLPLFAELGLSPSKAKQGEKTLVGTVHLQQRASECDRNSTASGSERVGVTANGLGFAARPRSRYCCPRPRSQSHPIAPHYRGCLKAGFCKLSG